MSRVMPLAVAGVVVLFCGATDAAERCAVLHEVTPGQIVSTVLPSLSVEGLAAERAFSLPPEAPPHVQAIQCGRDSLVPGPNDYKVLQAGFPLSLVAGDRIGMLEAVDGRLRFRMLDGTMTPQETAQLQDALNVAQGHFR
jgi:hypothetical protein